MNEYEKNVYTNLFEFPTKHIVKLELENEEKGKEIERLNNIINEISKIINEYQITSKLDSDYDLICNLKDKLKELKENDNNE